MRYGKINEAIWNDEKFQSLTDRSKLLYIYLLSCENCNSIGIFRIGYGAMEDGFGSERAEIKQGMEELQSTGLIGYQNGWLWFNKYLRWNEPTSPNHAKQCASYVNDCVRRGAPVEAVWGFLRTAREILGKLGSQRQESGERRSYYDVFKKDLYVDELINYMGGEDNLRDCLSGKEQHSTSASQALPKYSESAPNEAPEVSTPEALPKHSQSTSNTYNNKDKDNNKTRQDNDNKSIVLACNNGSSNNQISLTCSDGELHEVPASFILKAKNRYPDLDLNKAAQEITEKTRVDSLIRPDPKDIGIFFLKAIRFEGGNT